MAGISDFAPPHCGECRQSILNWVTREIRPPSCETERRYDDNGAINLADACEPHH
jgi:hypothetical protein